MSFNLFSNLGPAKPQTLSAAEFRNLRNARGYADGGEIPKKAMKSPRSPPRPAPRSVPAPPARPPPRPRTSGNPQEPEGKPASGKNLNAEYAVGGTVLRRPYNHRMVGMTSFEHGMIPKGIKFYNDSINISGAGFNQGGYFPGAEHQVI